MDFSQYWNQWTTFCLPPYPQHPALDIATNQKPGSIDRNTTDIIINNIITKGEGIKMKPWKTPAIIDTFEKTFNQEQAKAIHYEKMAIQCFSGNGSILLTGMKN